MSPRESVPAWVRTPAALPRYDGPLLLDTHIWIWHLEGNPERMAAGVPSLLERCGVAGGLRVLDISYWEVAIKAAKAQLVFSIDAGVWLKRARQAADGLSITRKPTPGRRCWTRGAVDRPERRLVVE